MLRSVICARRPAPHRIAEGAIPRCTVARGNEPAEAGQQTDLELMLFRLQQKILPRFG